MASAAQPRHLGGGASLINKDKPVTLAPHPWLAPAPSFTRRLHVLALLFRCQQRFLKAIGLAVGRCHVATLMRRMGIEALYRRPNTSKPAPGHKSYPYLLRH